jgi:hypothetical protein
MKLILFLLLLLPGTVLATFLPTGSCLPGQVRVAHPFGIQCVQRYPQTFPMDCIHCQAHYPQPFPTWFQQFPPAIYQPQPMPWWAHQGNLHYPNMHFPGAWNYPGMNPRPYPGNGPVFAAKPNVYVQSIHKEKSFGFKFPSKEKLSFLALTPHFQQDHQWNGKLSGDKFEVEGINYDYLFYDIRLPKEPMQFEAGVCATREAAIEWMLKDLKELRFSQIALQDFEEHWRVKIPDYPFYCIYPQYNEQLNAALPVEIELEQSSFVRSLYILVPHKTEPDAEQEQFVSLPFKDSEPLRPSVKLTRENMFSEWGVAFLAAP